MDDEYDGIDAVTLASLVDAQATWVEGANYGRAAAVMREAAKRLRESARDE